MTACDVLNPTQNGISQGVSFCRAPASPQMGDVQICKKKLFPGIIIEGLNAKIKHSQKLPFNRLPITEGIDQKVQIPIDLFNEMFDCLRVIEIVLSQGGSIN